MTLLEICEWLETTALAIAIQESLYGFALLVGAHILGVALSVGTLLWVDLRLLGLALLPRPLTEIYRSLAPWFAAGFGLMLLSGTALFVAFATAAYGNLFFRIKLLLCCSRAPTRCCFIGSRRGPRIDPIAQRRRSRQLGLPALSRWRFGPASS
jgi:hypothetical protein